MILYQLRCENDHQFEAWFRDSAAYDQQAKRRLLSCAVCGTAKVEKAMMAPSVSKTASEKHAKPAQGAKRDATKSGGTKRDDKQVAAPDQAAEMRQQLRDLKAKVEESCDYVGPRFAEEARKIHYGETEAHGIYGESTAEESRELKDEGIEFATVPWVRDTDA
ncbi:MAG: DUF1178 family protein [Rhodospirillaceae bacterium]|jgi:hypothetical protein|nr:DUF1178 family protein [Rhodospirillaceae bacterium]MBT6137661.1 DUF1178 family protein [Rhodospirillaceae bacterium]